MEKNNNDKERKNEGVDDDDEVDDDEFSGGTNTDGGGSADDSELTDKVEIDTGLMIPRQKRSEVIVQELCKATAKDDGFEVPVPSSLNDSAILRIPRQLVKNFRAKKETGSFHFISILCLFL
jgi:hypothetical protein